MGMEGRGRRDGDTGTCRAQPRMSRASSAPSPRGSAPCASPGRPAGELMPAALLPFLPALGVPGPGVPAEEADREGGLLHRGVQDPAGPRVRHGVPGQR